MREFLLVAAVAVSVLPALAVAPAGTAEGKARELASNAKVFLDSPTDGGLAPEVTSVSLYNDNFGNVFVSVDVPGIESPRADVWVSIVVDADQDASTGSDGTPGAEYLVQLDGADQTVTLFWWDGEKWDPREAPTLDAYWWYGAEFVFNIEELGLTGGFDFYVLAGWQDTDDRYLEDFYWDRFPDAGVESFQVATAGPLLPPSVDEPTQGEEPEPPAAPRYEEVLRGGINAKRSWAAEPRQPIDSYTTHLVPISTGSKKQLLQLTVAIPNEEPLQVRLLVGGPNRRTIQPTKQDPSHRSFDVILNRPAERSSMLLVVENSQQEPARYQIEHRAR